MSKLDDVLKGVVDDVDGGVACGVVDLSSGMLMGIYNNSNYPHEMNDLVAAARWISFEANTCRKFKN